MNHIDADCSIGPNTAVWQFASVIRGAVIGGNCSIGSCAIVDGATLGDRCSVGHGAQVHPGALIASDVLIGPGAILCNDRWPSTDKTGFDLAALKHGATIIVEHGASIGAGAVILPGVRIGPGAVIAAHATVDRDVPAGVFQRDGSIRPIPTDWRARRMRLLA